ARTGVGPIDDPPRAIYGPNGGSPLTCRPMKCILTPHMKRAQRKPRNGDTRDPLFNQSVEKALAILEVFGGERRAMNLAEISAAVGMTKSSAQRCTHTLERLGYPPRDPPLHRSVPTTP